MRPDWARAKPAICLHAIVASAALLATKHTHTAHSHTHSQMHTSIKSKPNAQRAALTRVYVHGNLYTYALRGKCSGMRMCAYCAVCRLRACMRAAVAGNYYYTQRGVSNSLSVRSVRSARSYIHTSPLMPKRIEKYAQLYCCWLSFV